MSDETETRPIQGERAFGAEHVILTEGREVIKAVGANSANISPQAALDLMGGTPFAPVPDAPAPASPPAPSTAAGTSSAAPASTDTD